MPADAVACMGPADGAVLNLCRGDLGVHRDDKTVYAMNAIPQERAYVSIEFLGSAAIDRKTGRSKLLSPGMPLMACVFHS